MPRFFVEKGNDSLIEIFGDDAHHISRSLRMKEGESLTVCDFYNMEYDCVAEKITDTSVLARVVGKHPSKCEPSIKVTVYQAMPKGDKLESVVQKAVELGAMKIVPVLTERCVARPDVKSAAKKCERLRKISLEAAKQCGRAVIPEIGELIGFDKAVEEMSHDDLAFLCYEKESEYSLKRLLSDNTDGLSLETARVSFLIGSEGGLSEEEVSTAKANGISSVCLGKRILRTETAPVVVLSALMFYTGNLD